MSCVDGDCELSGAYTTYEKATDIKNASSYKDEQAHSVSRIGVVADKFIKNLKNEL